MKHWPLDVKPPINYRLKYKLEYHSNEILGLQIDNISAVSFNLKFMCFTEHFPSFAPNAHIFYIFRHCINIVFILQKNHITPLTFIFSIK